MLGAADAELLFEAVDAVAAEDPRGVLLGVEKMARSGRDPGQFARDLLAHLRHLLVIQTTGEIPATFVVTASDEARLQAQAGAVSAASLVRTIDELASALTNVREGDEARMAVEIALLKAARPDLDPSTEGLLRRIERLEAGRGPSDGGGKGAGPVAADASERDDPEPEAAAETPQPTPAPEAEADADEGAALDSAEADVGTGPGAGPAAPDALTLDEVQRIWPAVLQKLAETAPALAATFEGARPVAMDEEGLQIGFPEDRTFNKRKAESPERREAVAAAFAAVAGQALRPTYVLLDGETAESEPEGEEAPPGDIDHDALVEKLKSEFDAEEVS
jgi:DNA polymerase-3 subunit gamma/tau